jgi:hypothetical protein
LRIAQQQPLEWASLHGKRSDLSAALLPYRAWVYEKAAIGVASQRQAPLDLGKQRVTMPGGYRDPPLRIQRECTATLKHAFLLHFFALNPTFSHSTGTRAAGQALTCIFFNHNKHLELFSRMDYKKIHREIKKLQTYLQVLYQQCKRK